MAKNKSKMIILDGNALIHRSFHALPTTLRTKSGEIVNAVYGFTSFLLKALKEFQPQYVVLTLDKKGPTFRHKEYAEYKAKRVKAPDELYEQFGKIKKVAQVLGLPIYEKSGYEADDLIGTIVQQINGQIEKIIVTGDMDTLQLVNENTFVYAMSRGLTDSVLYTPAAVKQRYGLEPTQMIDYKALRGDPSDNIPGVPGIGEKTATELIKNFGTIDRLYEAVDEMQKSKIKNQNDNVKFKIIKPRILELLMAHKQEAFFSKKLVTLDCQAPIKFKLASAKFGDYDEEDAIALFTKLEFKSLLPRLQELGRLYGRTELKLADRAKKKIKRNKKFQYYLIDDDQKFADFLKQLKHQKKFTLDTETSGLDIFSADLLGLSFSWKRGQAYYLALNCQQAQPRARQTSLFDEPSSRPAHTWLSELKPILENAKIKKFGHNLKFDIKILSRFGVKTAGLSFDTMIASYLLNPSSRQHNLDTLVFSEFGFAKISKEELFGTGQGKINFSQVPMDKLMLYSCEDADFTHRLVNKLSAKLKKEKLDKLFKEIEMPLIEVLAEMENNGIKVNSDYLAKLEKTTDQRIKALQKKIWQMAGSQFNINSVQQLRQVLFNKLKISSQGIGKTKTGLSTGADELDKLKDAHPIIKLIVDYRELAKLSNTYIKALPQLINPVTKRVHTNYNQTITATGRLSSNNPNLQNIPARSDLGRLIRQAFIADSQHHLVSLDYSQIELRLAASLSGDDKMLDAFRQGQDIHQATASAINQVALADVTPAMRQAAKATNFGVLYGQGPHGLSQAANISFNQAKDFIDKYFTVYDQVKKYLDKTIEQARQTGYVSTLFHRKRYLLDINSNMPMARRAAERMAVNMPIQGTAADLMKIAMRQVYDLVVQKYPRQVKMLLQVHDELVLEMDKDIMEEAAKKIKEIMEKVVKLAVVIKAEAKTGQNWAEMKKLDI